MPKKAVEPTRRIRVVPVVSFLIAVAIITATWTWWTKVYTDPQHVFWYMVDNNLSTSSVVKQISETVSPESFNETIFLQFSPYDTAHAKTTINEAGATIQTEEINPPPVDYIRYTSIQTTTKSVNQNILKTGLVGQWAKSNVPTDPSTQLYNQSLFGVIPLGNVSIAERHLLVSYMKQHNVYTMHFSQESTENGRKVYAYKVTVNPSGYVGMLREYGKSLNLQTIAQLSASSYSTSPITVTASVDAVSHNLLSVSYPSQNHTETYSGYNLNMAPSPLPAHTISVSQLENLLYSATK